MRGIELLMSDTMIDKFSNIALLIFLSFDQLFILILTKPKRFNYNENITLTKIYHF